MRQREEITDLLADKAYTAKNSDGYVFKKNKVLKFNYEGSITSIRITRIDRKNKRAWGEHIELVDQKIVVSHTGHDVYYGGDIPFCNDCGVPVTEPAAEDGQFKAAERQDKELSDGTRIE